MVFLLPCSSRRSHKRPTYLRVYADALMFVLLNPHFEAGTVLWLFLPSVSLVSLFLLSHFLSHFLSPSPSPSPPSSPSHSPSRTLSHTQTLSFSPSLSFSCFVLLARALSPFLSPSLPLPLIPSFPLSLFLSVLFSLSLSLSHTHTLSLSLSLSLSLPGHLSDLYGRKFFVLLGCLTSGRVSQKSAQKVIWDHVYRYFIVLNLILISYSKFRWAVRVTLSNLPYKITIQFTTKNYYRHPHV